MATILVVEDTSAIRFLVTYVLKTRGHEVVTAENGLAVAETMRITRPALVLLDMSMPYKDGWTTVQELRADPELRDIPVVALTAHALPGDRERALSLGCVDYMSKPFEADQLLDLVDRHLAGQ